MARKLKRVVEWQAKRDLRERILWLRLGFRCIKIIYRREHNKILAAKLLKRFLLSRVFGAWAEVARADVKARKEAEAEARAALAAAARAAQEAFEAEQEREQEEEDTKRLQAREKRKFDMKWKAERAKAEAQMARARAVQVRVWWPPHLPTPSCSLPCGGWLCDGGTPVVGARGVHAEARGGAAGAVREPEGIHVGVGEGVAAATEAAGGGGVAALLEGQLRPRQAHQGAYCCVCVITQHHGCSLCVLPSPSFSNPSVCLSVFECVSTARSTCKYPLSTATRRWNRTSRRSGTWNCRGSSCSAGRTPPACGSTQARARPSGPWHPMSLCP